MGGHPSRGPGLASAGPGSSGLNDQARRVQADCLRARGYDQDAEYVARGWAEFDPGALEMLPPANGRADIVTGSLPHVRDLHRHTFSTYIGRPTYVLTYVPAYISRTFSLCFRRYRLGTLVAERAV